MLLIGSLSLPPTPPITIFPSVFAKYNIIITILFTLYLSLCFFLFRFLFLLMKANCKQRVSKKKAKH